MDREAFTVGHVTRRSCVDETSESTSVHPLKLSFLQAPVSLAPALRENKEQMKQT